MRGRRPACRPSTRCARRFSTPSTNCATASSPCGPHRNAPASDSRRGDHLVPALPRAGVRPASAVGSADLAGHGTRVPRGPHALRQPGRRSLLRLPADRGATARSIVVALVARSHRRLVAAQAHRVFRSDRDLAAIRRDPRKRAGSPLFPLRLRLGSIDRSDLRQPRHVRAARDLARAARPFARPHRLVLHRHRRHRAAQDRPRVDVAGAPRHPREAALGAFGLSAGGFLAMLGLQRVIAPEWFAEFVRRSAGVDERGPSNPALLALIRDIVAQPPLAAAATVVAVAGILVLSGRALRRSGADPASRVMLVAVAYALIAPRFKDYSYVLLFPVGLHLLRRARVAVPLAAAIAFPLPRGARALAATGRYLETYYPLACALLAFKLLLDELSGPGPSPDVSGPP